MFLFYMKILALTTFLSSAPQNPLEASLAKSRADQHPNSPEARKVEAKNGKKRAKVRDFAYSFVSV